MDITFTKQSLEELNFWIKTNKKIATKIIKILESIERNPYAGLGKPEALKNNLTGFWSRRIDEKHRIVYKIKQDNCIVIQCKNHY